MKSLGKQNVLVENFLNGASTRTYTDNRVVYQDSNGEYHVNWFAGGKRQIIRRADGTFYQEVHVRTITAHSF